MASAGPSTRVTSSTVHTALCKISRLGGGTPVTLTSLLTYLRQNGHGDLWTGSLEKQVDAALHLLLCSRRAISSRPGYYVPASASQTGTNRWNVDQVQLPQMVAPGCDSPQLARWPEPADAQPLSNREIPIQQCFDQTPSRPRFPPIQSRGRPAPLNFHRMPSPPARRNWWSNNRNRSATAITVGPRTQKRSSLDPRRPSSVHQVRLRRIAPVAHHATKETQTTASLVAAAETSAKERDSAIESSTSPDETTPSPSKSTSGKMTSRVTRSKTSTSTASHELPRIFTPLNVTPEEFHQYITQVKGNGSYE